jgi:hypothetical protein
MPIAGAEGPPGATARTRSPAPRRARRSAPAAPAPRPAACPASTSHPSPRSAPPRRQRPRPRARRSPGPAAGPAAAVAAGRRAARPRVRGRSPAACAGPGGRGTRAAARHAGRAARDPHSPSSATWASTHLSAVASDDRRHSRPPCAIGTPSPLSPAAMALNVLRAACSRLIRRSRAALGGEDGTIAVGGPRSRSKLHAELRTPQRRDGEACRLGRRAVTNTPTCCKTNPRGSTGGPTGRRQASFLVD